MSCLHPKDAYWSKDVNASGKRGITFNRNASLTGIPFKLPCQQCVECRIKRVGQWATRMMHESKLHDENCYMTLTYAPEHLPPGATLVKRDVQLFHKRLHNFLLKRRGRGNGIRFFYSGEYGEKFGRPHYHSIVYKYRPPDLVFYKYNKQGDPLYKSEQVQKLWPFGDITVGDVTFASCSYVAGYVVDKINGKMADEHYWRYDPRDGRDHELLPEFSGQSNRPGIGYEWFRRYHSEFYKHDSVIVDEREIQPPRYYDKLFEGIDPDALKVLKDIRRRAAMKHRDDQSPERRRVKEVVAKAKLRMKGKEL